MGKQSNQPTPISQAQYDKDLNSSLEILHKDGASDQELIDYTNDFKSRFTVAKPTTQKKNPNQSGVFNADNGFSDFPESKSGFDIIADANQRLAKQPTPTPKKATPTAPKTKGDYAKSVFKDAQSKVDSNLTEERLQQEKEQSGFLNTVGNVAKNILNVTGTALSQVNETLGGDKDYFTIPDYQPLQDQKKRYVEKAKREKLPLTPDAIQKGAEDIFREEDKLQQLQKNIDAALPEDYDRQGIWKELKLENLKKNAPLKQAIVTADVYQKQLIEFDNFKKSIEKVPTSELSKEQINTYNNLLTDAKEATKGLNYLQESFPKLLQEVKTSDELVDVFKYNFNDYERALTNIKGFAKVLTAGTVKYVAEGLSYIDQKTDEPGKVPTSVDKALKKGLQVTKDVSNEILDEARSEKEQFISYKAKDINNFGDFGSYMAELGTNQLPIYLALAVAPELGSVLLGTSQAGDQFRNMEEEEMNPLSKKTNFGQKLLTSTIYGAAEWGFEKLGTVNVIKNIEASIARASTGSRTLMREGILSSVGRGAKQFGWNGLLEGTTEELTAEAQIGADRYVAKKEVSKQQANENRFESFTGGALMGGPMSVVGGLWAQVAYEAKLYSDNKDIQKTKDILSKIQGLSDELTNNPNLTQEDKDIIHKNMTDLAEQSFDVVVRNAEKGKTFSKEENSFLVAVNLMQDGLKTEFEKLKNSNLSAEQKKTLTDGLNAQFSQLEQNRQKTLKGEFSTIPDGEKVFKRETPQEDNLIDDNVNPADKQYNDIWVRNEKDIPTGPDRNPNDRYNVVSNSEELKLFQEQEANKQPVVEQPTADTTEQPLDGSVAPSVSPTLQTPTNEDISFEDAVSGLEDGNQETPTAQTETPTSTVTAPEITEQEYLDFVENDFLGKDRLNDIATKVRQNEDLNAFEKRIANKKEKEIATINQKIEAETNEANRKAEVDTLSKVPAMDKDEFLEYTNSETASEERLNAIAYKNANGIELNNFEKEVYQDNKRAVNKINKDRNLKENLLDKIPTEQKQTVKDGQLTVAIKDNELELYDEQGQPSTLTPKTKEKYFLEAIENGFMKRTEPIQYPEGITPNDIDSFELENETDPSVILEKLQKTETKLDGANVSDIKDYAIASYINKVTQSSFNRFSDKNNITLGIAKTYFSKDGAPIDTLAQEISESMGIEVTPQDVVDFILANPNGKRNILTVNNPEYQTLIDKFVELTGFAPTPSQIKNFKKKEVTAPMIDFEAANEVEVNNEIVERTDLVEAAGKFDKWFSTLSPQEQVEFYQDLDQDYPNEYYQQRYNEQQQYEQSEKITSTETPNGKGKSEPDGGVGKNPQQDRRESRNDNVPGRNSREAKSENGNANAGEQVVKPKKEVVKALFEDNQTPKSKRKVRDEKVDEELDDAFKDLRDELGKFMSGINPELAIKAAKIIAIYTKAGVYKLSDIMEDAYAKFGELSKEMFDAIKQGYASYYATAEDNIADQMDSNVRIFTYESIIDKIQNNEAVEQQPITDTKPIELKTKAIESKTDKLTNDREAKIPTERKLEIANDLLFDIDAEIENVNDQLRLLGFYEPNANDEIRENPHIYVERELKKDLTNFVKKLNERLKWEFDTDKKGKPIYASANVAPAGGDGTFILWVPNSEYGVYVSLSVQPKEYKEWYEQYELEPSILWRVTTKDNKYTGLSNQWMNSEDFTIPNLVDKFNKAVSFYLKQENGNNKQQQQAEQGVPSPIGTLQPNSKRPSETTPQNLLQKPSAEQGTGSRSQSPSNPVPRTARTVKQSPTGQGDLFSGNANFLEVEPKQPTPKQEQPKEKVEVQIDKINQVEKQEPALVDFAMQDNEQEKFNATKKYTDNINALETLLTVIKEKRKATSEEKNTLARYVGFGGLKEIAFNPDNEADWKESTAKYKEQVRKVMQLTQELDQALGINNSLSEIRAGILTAHYTPKTIIDTMFTVLERLGFKNGNILEPSAGIGNFIGYMPSKMRSNSNITAVELDNLTGSILKYLYDDVNTQIRGIQDAIIPDNSQDVVISNVPFGNFKVFDKAFKGNREFLTKRIHNYFFAKALDKAREGGIVMFVTSKGILDSKGNREVREYLNKNADLLGAVRLPSTAFQNNANTSVVTDVIILRKNTTSENKNPNFLDVVDLEVTDKNGEIKTITINKFFAENRNVLLGDIVPGGMYSEKDYSLTDADNKMGQMLDRLLLSNLRHHLGTFQPTTNLNATNRIETNQDLLENTKIGNLTISNEGKILKRLDSEMQEVSMPSYVKAKNVKKYIDTRVALFDLITAEYTGQPDSVVDTLRTKLNSLYLNAVQSIPAKEFNRIATEDGDGFNVLSLTDKAGKRADILSKRTINPLQQKQNTDNVDEAIIISLYENAHIDMDRIAELMQKPVKEILEAAKGKIFESPIGGFFTRDEYLSGNVKKKLAEVNQAIESGYSEFENNKAELEAVIPKDIPAVSIEVRLGSRWVPIDVINDFAEHLFKDDGVVINYAKSTDTYNNNGKIHSVNASEKWGTKRKNGADLLVDALHAATPAIYDTIDDKRVLNKEETEKAVQKFEEIRAEFENWIYTNAERRERLGQIYNEKYNTTVRRKYEGSHLNIPGINGVNLYPHQKDAIWMLLQNNGGIIDHIVGAGKTFIMVAGTAEMKRTGVAKKPMILALKSTIPQIVETYKQSYPLAKILSPSEKDFQAKNRQQLFSQIALNDWDVIIMSHENYQAIPHHPDYVRKQIDDEIAEIEEEREALSGDKKALSGLETRLKNLQAKLEKITDVAKDNAVYFQQMGIDHIMVDESQQFKNLAYMTKQRNVAGLSKAEGSRRAFNLLVGMRYFQEILGADKGTTFLSGTPISNSMVEMYSLLKYMRPNKMKELGFNTFDQWATTFASPTNEVEYTVTGQFKSKTRFREFINVPELSLLYNEIADVRNDDNLTLDKPTMKGGGYTTMFIPMNEEQADYGQRIIQFAKTKDGSVLGLDLSENQLTAYMLLATNLSSKMAIDMRLINKDYAYDPNGKVGKMTDEVIKVYTETNEHKGAQLIFSDLGTPKNKNNQSEMLKDYMEDELGVPSDTLVEIFGNFAEEGHRYQPFANIRQKAIDILEIEESDFDEYMEQARQSGETFNLYDEIKKRLIEKGIPENEIVFIHSYNNQKQKEKLFEQVNNGEIRVVLGSTQKLGTGVNVQKRLAAIHHLDVPWRPSDMEQRNGRGIRQGNWIAKTHLNNEMPVYAYATEKTLDGYKYQLLQTKQRFLDQVKSGNIEDRVVKENSEEGSDAYAIFVAELSGNKDILLKFKLEQEKERLTKQRRNFEGSLYEAQGNVRRLESNIPSIENNVHKSKLDIQSITNKAEYDVTKDDETGIETKKLKIDNINGEVLQPEKDSKEAKENKPVDRTEYGKKAIGLIAQTVKTIQLGEYKKSFDINGLPILVKVTNKREFSNGKEFMIQKTELAILSPSGQTYTVNNASIPGVLLNNIQKAIESIPIVLEMQEKVLEKNKKDLTEYKELAKNDKFPKEEELKAVSEELKEIDKRIQDFEKDENEELDQDENIANEPSDDYQKNTTLVLNKTQDGQEFLSLSEPGSEYSNSSQPNLWQQGDRDSGNDNRRTVRAVWTKYKNIQFKGTTKIKNAEDVAQIMSLLENKSVEHAFAIHIDQQGNSHIQFLSIGGVTGTVVDTGIVSAGVAKFNSKKVYLVHNHPSGKMLPSNADLEITKKLREGLNPLGIIVEHIIMDTYLKQYVHIDNDNLFTVNTRGENTFTKKLTPVDLSEQEVLGEHFGKVTSSDKAFSIIQNFRFSAMPKNAMLVMNNSNQVIGNYVFSNGNITYPEILKFVGETGTATGIIFYGNQMSNLSQVNDFKTDLAKLSITVLDKIVTSSNGEAVQDYYKSMSDDGMLREDQEKYGTVINKNNIVNDPGASYNKDLRLPQTVARQALTKLKEDTLNKVDNDTKLQNAIDVIQNTDWYQNLDDIQKSRVNRTTIKSLLENAVKDLNSLENKIEEYKQKLKDNKMTSKQVFDDVVAFLKENQIYGKITPTEVNRLIKSASQINTRRDTAKALDDFMNLYEIIKEKALLRSDKRAREKAEVEFVVPAVEMMVANGYDLQQVLYYFETNSQKRMAEIQYHKEKSKYATEEERVNKTNEAIEKQKQDLFNATFTSFREGLKKARLYWFNLISDRSYVPANLMSKTGMQQTYYQFKNTKGYGYNAKEMYEKAHDKIWKGLTQNKIELLHDFIQMMRIITIDENRAQNELGPVQHPNNLSSIDAQSWLDEKKAELGDKQFNNIEKRAKEYFKTYQAVLDLKLENGFITQETYDALNGLDYQPRMFLHHAVNFDGDLSFEQKQHIINRSGLSKEQIQSLEDGSANSLILDAQWLLSNSISTLYQDIADNKLNSLFIAEEFPIAKEKYDDLLTVPQSQLTKEERRFIKYFKELSDKVIPNEVIGFSATNNDPIYKNETPKGFVNKYYWADGVKHQFFMEENLALQFDGAKGVFLTENSKEVVGNITGARLVKYFATGNNPLFVIVNTPRDFMWNILVSEHYSGFVSLAIAQMTYQLFPSTYDFIRTKLGYENTDMNLYMQHGGSMDYLHKQGQIAKKSFAYNVFVKPTTSVLGKNNQPIVEDKLRNNYLSKAIGALNEWSELAFRIATFRRSVNAQLKELGFNNESEIGNVIDENGTTTQTRQEILDNIYRKATYDARSVLDFGQGGRLVKDLESFIPYLNVGVQATRSYADAMQDRPISTTLKTFQIAIGGIASTIALAMFMLAGDDDEPEEEKGKTTERKYIEFMQGISEETRSKYYIIPTKKRDEEGNRIFYKIAKDQILIPYNNIVETLIENKIRTRAGFKEVGWNKIGKRLYKDVLENNLSAKSLKDVPLFKAGTAWYAGYDLYRNKPLDKYAKSEALEGMGNPNVEDFYKYLGAEFKTSPIRTKYAIESMITSPQSNPYLATGYEVMDYSFTDKSMDNLGKGVKEMLLKGLKNRTTGKSTEWTRSENLLRESEDAQLDIMLKEEAVRQLFKDKAKETSQENISEAVKDLKEQFKDDPNLGSYLNSFKSEYKKQKLMKDSEVIVRKLTRINSPGARATAIIDIYGDVIAPENVEVFDMLKKNRVINAATLKYLQVNNKKTAN